VSIFAHHHKRMTENHGKSLVEQLKEGRRKAAEQFVDRYHKQIFYYMRRLGHDYQTSEDLTQEVFISAWEHIDQLRRAGSLKGWLYRIASNVSGKHYRRLKNIEISGDEVFEAMADDDSMSSRPEYRERLELVKNAVDELSLKLKETIVLHYMQDLTISETAEALGIREGTLKNRLNRALRKLEKQLNSENLSNDES